MKLDLRLTGGPILTMDDRHPVAHDLGIWAGRVVGYDSDIADLPAARVVDLGGATALPGFLDAHTHLVWSGLAALSLNLTAFASRDHVLSAVAAAVREAAPGAWVEVDGYDQRLLGGVHLTRHDLDPIAAGRKVFLRHVSGHASVVSSSVLDILDPAELAAHPGDLLLDPDGRPSGVLMEDAHALVRRARSPYSVEELSRALTHSARACLTEGVTFCAEAGVGGGLVSASPVELAAYQHAAAAGELPIRVQAMVSADALRTVRAHPADHIARAIDLGIHTGFGSDRLGLGAVKLWLDGGMSVRTAALTEPYEGTDERGLLIDDPDGTAALISEVHAAGWQLALHAIGDRAVDLALDCLEAAQKAHPRPDARHRIEHCGLVRPDQLPRIARLGVIPVIQPAFLHAFGDDYAAIMGERRAPWMYRGRGFLDHGIPVVGSSDRPVASGAPLRAIQFMTDRLSRTGVPVGPDEALTVDEALRAYTVDAAHACHRDHDLGALSPGKLADITVLAADPRTVDPAGIAEIPVLATAVGGEFVHDTGLAPPA